MHKFVMLGELCVRLDEVCAFSVGVEQYSMQRDLRLWLKSTDFRCGDQIEFIVADRDGALFARLQRALEIG